MGISREDAKRDVPDGLVLGICDVARDEVSVLAEVDAAIDLLNGDDWESDLGPES